VVLEVLATVYVFVAEGRYVPARTRFGQRPNTFINDLISNRADCSYLDTLYPHPYVAFVHHRNQPCGLDEINNVGLFGSDFPSVRPENRFVILLTGGSVAAQVAEGVSGGPSYLERLLNERYESPNGKPFLVLDGGDGAWKQPQQAILLLLYVDVVHAVVTLDGYNERAPILSLEQRFEYPNNNFHAANPLASQHFGDLVTQWLAARLRMFAAGNPVLSRSQAAYSLVSAAEGWARRRMSQSPAPRTSLETIFSLPSDLPREEQRMWQLNLYRKYVRAMHAIARENGVMDAYFIQPVPAIDKPLSEEEKRVVGEFAYRDVYLQMTRSLLEMNDNGVPVSSLLNVFADDQRTLYADDIHLRRDSANVSAGYERLADRMASELGRLWKLRQRGSVR
jgi:hypothetical protein